MKKKLLFSTLLIVVVSIILIFIISNGKDVKPGDTIHEIQDKYAFIYSHAFNEESYFITTDDGKHFHDQTLKLKDIFNLQNNQDGKLYLIQRHYSVLYEIDQNGILHSSKLHDPLTFVINDKEIKITSYNQTIDKNVLEVNDNKNNKHYTLDFSPYLQSAIYDDQNIYLLNNSVDANKSVLHVINREKGKVTNSIDLNSSAQSIIKFHSELVISTEQSLSIVSIKDHFKVRTINYPKKGNISPDQLYTKNEQMYVSYGDYLDGSCNIWVLDKEYKTITDKKLDTLTPYTRIKFFEGKVFVLVQNEQGKDGGQLNIFHLSDLKKESVIVLPKKNIKVQDFIVR